MRECNAVPCTGNALDQDPNISGSKQTTFKGKTMSIATKALATAANFSTLTFTGGGYIDISHAVLKSGGVVKFVAPLSPGRRIYSGDSGNFPAYALAFTMAGTGGAVVADSVALAFLDGQLGSGTPASYDLGLFSAAPLSDGTGGTEFPATGSYATINVTNDVTNFPAGAMV